MFCNVLALFIVFSSIDVLHLYLVFHLISVDHNWGDLAFIYNVPSGLTSTTIEAIKYKN